MGFLKRNWFKVAILVPLVPLVILTYSLSRFAGIDRDLLLLGAAGLITSGLVWFFLGFYLEVNKGNVEKKLVKFKIGSYRFGLSEVFRLLLGISSIGLFYAAFQLSIWSLQFSGFIQNVTVTHTPVSVQRGYSFVALSDFNIENQNSYNRIAVLRGSEEQAEAVEIFLAEQNIMLNPIIVLFDSPLEQINALYDQEVTGIIIGDNFVDVFNEIERFDAIHEDTIILSNLYLDVEIAERNNEIAPGEPFSIILLGLNQNDHALTTGNINVFMLLTVNFDDLSFTITSIPRDSYVWIPRWQRYDKLSHTNAGGPHVAIETIEHMFDMEIPYYVKLNFTGFMEIVDILGGVEVDVPFSFSEQDSRRRFGEHMIHVESGLQRLNAEQALAFARHRNNYRTSEMIGDDFARVGNQQIIFQAMLREMLENVRDIQDIFALLEVLGQNVDTNFRSTELMALGSHLLTLLQVRSGTDLLSEIHFINMVIMGQPDAIGWDRMAVVFPYYERIAEARMRMMINLGIEEPAFSFNFSFDGFRGVRTQWGESGMGTPVMPEVPVFIPPPVYDPIILPTEPEYGDDFNMWPDYPSDDDEFENPWWTLPGAEYPEYPEYPEHPIGQDPDETPNDYPSDGNNLLDPPSSDNNNSGW